MQFDPGGIDGPVGGAEVIGFSRVMALLDHLFRPSAILAQRPAHRGVPARLWRARGGATAVEMAFLLPVFMLFLLGICEFGRGLWTQTALQFAVEAAARCAAVSPSLCTAAGGTSMDIPGYAASQAFGMSIPASTFTYTPNATCGVASGSTGTGGAQVTASYAFPAIVPALVPVDVTLSAKSCHP
jgi:Flp pilus assembly protein TadG